MEGGRVEGVRGEGGGWVKDLCSLGSTTAAVRDEVERRGNIVCGSKGMATVLVSEVPSGKGRPTPPKRQGAASATSANGATPFAFPSLEGLPAAESAYQEYKDKGELKRLLAADYSKLLSMGQVEGRYAEPVSFRFSNRPTARAVCIVPATNSPWMQMELVKQDELSVGGAPNSFVDMSASATAKARAGEVVFKGANALTNKNLRHQRGDGFYKAYFDDLAKAGAAVVENATRGAPVLYVSLYFWAGDDLDALVRWTAEASTRDARTSKIYGLFHDPKEMHYLIGKARRNARARELYENAVLRCDGFMPVPVPETLRKLREECGKGATHEQYPLLAVAKSGDEFVPVVPDEASLRLVVDEPLRKRLAELREQFPGPLPIKRARVDAPGTAGGDAGACWPPRAASLMKLLEHVVIKQRGALSIDAQDFVVLWVERKSNPLLTMHYLQNNSTKRCVVAGLQHVSSSTGGTYIDKLSEKRASLREGALEFEWKLSPRSYLCYQFGASAEVITTLPEMIKAARAASACQELNLYAHTLADSALPGGATSARVVTPHPRKTVDVVLQLDPLPGPCHSYLC